MVGQARYGGLFRSRACMAAMQWLFVCLALAKGNTFHYAQGSD